MCYTFPMKQLSFLQENMSITSCAFTGHRVLEKDFSLKKLKKQTESLILSGVHTFYNGMAEGFDLLAAKMVLALKKKFPYLRLIACIPCYNQEKYFSADSKKDYVKILSACDEKVYLSQTYHKGCMLNRNKYMVDHADCLIAYCKKETGGTAFTVNYFKKTKNVENMYLL